MTAPAAARGFFSSSFSISLTYLPNHRNVQYAKSVLMLARCI